MYPSVLAIFVRKRLWMGCRLPFEASFSVVGWFSSFKIFTSKLRHELSMRLDILTMLYLSLAFVGVMFMILRIRFWKFSISLFVLALVDVRIAAL